MFLLGLTYSIVFQTSSTNIFYVISLGEHLVTQIIKF